MKRTVNVSLLGEQFAVRSDRDPADVHSLAAYVTRKFDEVRRHSHKASPHQVALLVALNLTEELFSAREAAAELRVEVRENTRALLAKVTEALGELSELRGDEAAAAARGNHDDDDDDERDLAFASVSAREEVRHDPTA